MKKCRFGLRCWKVPEEGKCPDWHEKAEWKELIKKYQEKQIAKKAQQAAAATENGQDAQIPVREGEIEAEQPQTSSRVSAVRPIALPSALPSSDSDEEVNMEVSQEAKAATPQKAKETDEEQCPEHSFRPVSEQGTPLRLGLGSPLEWARAKAAATPGESA